MLAELDVNAALDHRSVRADRPLVNPRAAGWMERGAVDRAPYLFGMQFDSLDMWTCPTEDVDASARRYVEELGAELLWKVRGMGTVVALPACLAGGAAILLSGHLQCPQPPDLPGRRLRRDGRRSPRCRRRAPRARDPAGPLRELPRPGRPAPRRLRCADRASTSTFAGSASMTMVGAAGLEPDASFTRPRRRTPGAPTRLSYAPGRRQDRTATMERRRRFSASQRRGYEWPDEDVLRVWPVGVDETREPFVSLSGS